MNKIRVLLAFLISFSGLSYAQEFDPAFSAGRMDSISVPVPGKTAVEPATDEKASVKKLTIMVFMNAKNNLEMAGLYNMNRMETTGSTKDMNILVEMGRMNGQAEGDTDLDGNWTGVRRYYVKKDSDPEKIKSQVVFEQAEYDMGDYKQAVEFVKWTKEKYPAKKYVLILWDHGTGWLDPQQKSSEDKGISFDDETGNYIRTKQIGRILKDAGRVDILAFDACLMQMTEVLTEVKDYTSVVVGSEETIPGTGYPYDLIVGALARNPDLSAEEIGAVMVEAFKMFYEKMKRSAILSAVRSSKIDGLNKLAADFAKLAMEAKDLEALKKARTDTMRFDILGPGDENMTISFFGDLHQFADIAGGNVTKTEPAAVSFKSKAEELKNFIANDLVIHKGGFGANRAGKNLEDAGGISVYIPPAAPQVPQEKLEGIFEAPYTTFDFNTTTKWHDFATFMYNEVK